MEIYHIAVCAILAWLLLGTCANIAAFPGVRRGRSHEPRRDATTAPPPLVSVLVPARDEERNIGALAASLKAQQDLNFEVLVLDDRSTDRTLPILEAHGFVDAALDPGARFRYLRGQPLPGGWAGKPWACHQLFQAARGDWLLFTDADTLHEPDSLQAAVESATRMRADLLSAWPRQITGTWSERLVIPLLYILTHTLLPQVFVRLLLACPALARFLGPTVLASLGAANGQFLLFHRAAYEKIGGHAAVRSHLVEDVALGRLVLARAGDGMRLCNAHGGRIVACRMYHGFREVWQGFSKNLRPVFGTNSVAFVGSGLIQLALFVAPFVFLWLPVSGHTWVVGQVALILAIRALLAARFHGSWLSVPLHPIGYTLALAIALNSWRWSLRRRIVWKGREYAG